MGFLDTLLGNDAADASRRAAADTYGKQTAATAGLREAGDTFASRFGALGSQLGDLSKSFQPWKETGQTANDAVARLLADPSSVRSLPGYQFGIDEGNKSILAGNNATGNLFSGKTGKALESYGINYADTKFGDHLARLLGVSQQGLDATGRGVATEGAGIGMVGQGETGRLGARTSAYNGDMTSAGTIGQGDVAAANAEAQGMQNLFNMISGGIGSIASMGGGGGMSSFSRLLGGGGPSGPTSLGSGQFGHMPLR